MQGRVRPGKAPSAMAVIVGLGMLVFGIATLPAFGAFGVFWTFMVLVIIGFNAYNLVSDRGVATEVIDVETTAPRSAPAAPAGERTAADRLAELGSLYSQGLITEQEYAEKRRNIVDGL